MIKSKLKKNIENRIALLCKLIEAEDEACERLMDSVRKATWDGMNPEFFVNDRLYRRGVLYGMQCELSYLKSILKYIPF